jgi:hypothetical protein
MDRTVDRTVIDRNTVPNSQKPYKIRWCTVITVPYRTVLPSTVPYTVGSQDCCQCFNTIPTIPKLHTHSLQIATPTRRVLPRNNYYQLSPGASFSTSLQPCWSPLICFFIFMEEEFYGTQCQRGSFYLIYVGSGFQNTVPYRTHPG